MTHEENTREFELRVKEARRNKYELDVANSMVSLANENHAKAMATHINSMLRAINQWLSYDKVASFKYQDGKGTFKFHKSGLIWDPMTKDFNLHVVRESSEEWIHISIQDTFDMLTNDKLLQVS